MQKINIMIGLELEIGPDGRITTVEGEEFNSVPLKLRNRIRDRYITKG